MGSACWYEKCPQCNNTAYFEYDCRRYVDWIMCPMCGYQYFRRPILDRKSQPLEYKFTKNGKLIFRRSEQKGYGVAFIHWNRGSSTFHSMHKEVTPAIIKKFTDHLTNNDIDAEKSYLTRWDEETQTVIAVIGKPINPLEEECSTDYSNTF